MTRVSPLVIVRVASTPFEALVAPNGARARDAADSLLALMEARAAEAERVSAVLYEAAGEGAPQAHAASRGAVLRIRRAIHQGRGVGGAWMEEAGPLLGTDQRALVNHHIERSAALEQARQNFWHAYAAEAELWRTALMQAAEAPFFRLGLRLAARTLLQRLSGLRRADSAVWDQRARHTASKLWAYLGRSATKTSPNGVFCLTGLGNLTDGPAASRGENQIGRLDFLFHVGEARKITACLAASPEAMASVTPRVNPTLRRDGEGWMLWRPATARRPEDDETRCQVKDHPVMRMFLDAAAPERRAVAEIIRDVEKSVGRDVRPFFAQLVERGILIAEIEIPWSERRPLRTLAARCPGAPWASELEAVEEDLESLVALPPEEIVPRMDALAARLESLPHARPLTKDDLIRCDAATRLGIDLPRPLLRDLERMVPLYARLYGAIYPEALTREWYAARFLARYTSDTPIPLLDFYHGLFEPHDATRPAAFVSPDSGVSGQSGGSGRSDSKLRAAAGAAFERARDFFAECAHVAAATGAEQVDLSEADWEEITGDAPEPRFACAALFQVAACSLEEVGTLRARVCLNAFFPGAGLSVARLAHLHAPAAAGVENPIVRQLRDGWKRQARPGAAHAEITFMHGARTANAGLRPPIFPLEIELPGDRVSEGHEAVPLSDLTAAWDSGARRFVVRSLSRGTEILPVICSGINPEGFVSFLTMVGAQDLQPLAFLPGFDVAGIRSWPRFSFGNVVLFRRRWVFEAADLPGVDSREESFLMTRRWRREHGLPEHVFVHFDRDPKPFYVDLGSEPFVDLFRRALASQESGGRVHVTEMLPGPEELWVRDSRGRYASEFLVHLDNLDRFREGSA
jgi:Lantibiotic dehydratase, N terminus